MVLVLHGTGLQLTQFNNPTENENKNMTTPPTKKSINWSPLRLGFILITLLLACFALSQRAQGVSPPPPGGYPNFTTAAGDHALQALTLGLGNTALGTFSLFSVTTGNFNTAVGAGALDLNTADSNTATGAAALLFNTTGTENTANGTAALEFNDTGSDNTAIGAFALFSNTEGIQNTAIGGFALESNILGTANVAIGQSALSNTDAFSNTVVGFETGLNLTLPSSSGNIYIGDSAGTQDFTGDSPGDEDGVIRIGSAFSGRFACFINGIATNSQVWNGVSVCQVTVDASGQLGVDCLNPNNPSATPASPHAPVSSSGPQQPATRPQRQAMLNDKVEKLQATVAQLTQQLKEQAAQIQKVSAQLETRKPAPQVAENNR